MKLNLTYARDASSDNSAEFETAVKMVGLGQGLLLISDLSPSLIRFENPGSEEVGLVHQTPFEQQQFEVGSDHFYSSSFSV